MKKEGLPFFCSLLGGSGSKQRREGGTFIRPDCLSFMGHVGNRKQSRKAASLTPLQVKDANEQLPVRMLDTKALVWSTLNVANGEVAQARGGHTVRGRRGGALGKAGLGRWGC